MKFKDFLLLVKKLSSFLVSRDFTLIESHRIDLDSGIRQLLLVWATMQFSFLADDLVFSLVILLAFLEV